MSNQYVLLDGKTVEPIVINFVIKSVGLTDYFLSYRELGNSPGHCQNSIYLLIQSFFVNTD